MKQTTTNTSISENGFNSFFSIIFSPISFSNHYEDAKKEPLPPFPNNALINQDVESPPPTPPTPNKINDDQRKVTKNNNK